jgi:CheY-like chemotaxis protein
MKKMMLKILVADDSITIQKMVNLAFNNEDAMVEVVSSGEAVMGAIHSFKPDIVLVNVCMPGGNGYEICERVKNIPELQDIPVLLLVGAFESFDEAEAARVRSNGHLVKPFNTSELIETVHSLVKEKKMISHDGGVSINGGSGNISALPAAESSGAVDERVWESFTGSGQILELFDRDTMTAAATMSVKYRLESEAKIKAAAEIRAAQFTDGLITQVVDRVVQKMSPDVIREVAWEVVPELSELLIRQVIEQQKH